MRPYPEIVVCKTTVSPPLLECRNLSKSWRTAEKEINGLQGLSFEVRQGEICAMVGPSGCGKTTALKILAGLDTATSGTALFDGNPVEGQSTDRVLVFQEPALFPWRSAIGNVEFPLQMAKVEPRERSARALKMMERVGLAEFANARPHELSKGMQQRLAIAAALVMEPKALLMDEPFAALDVRTRLHMQKFLVEIWEKTGTTIIIVTHQIEESLLLADHIVLLTARPGRVKWETHVDKPRPSAEEFFSSEFTGLREYMLRLFYEEVTA
jgi:NitT/TauT family transport system ATP-binding protein